MDMSSNMYKLVNSEGIIIAEGSAKVMDKLRKKNHNSRVWIAPDKKIGDKLGKPIENKPTDPFLELAKRICDDPIKKKFIDNL